MSRNWFLNILIGMILMVVTLAIPSHAFDIEACITEQWGDDLAPIKVFDQDVSVGDTVKAYLCRVPECNGGNPQIRFWYDYMPTYSLCPGFGMMDADYSVISRITPGTNCWEPTTLAKERLIIFVRHAGGRGFWPGSAGYVRILNPEWKITRILNAFVNNHYSGSGVEVDRDNQEIRWSGRGSCPACICRETQTEIAFLVEQTDEPALTSQGDANCDGELGPGDVVYLINYFFKGGPQPCDSAGILYTPSLLPPETNNAR